MTGGPLGKTIIIPTADIEEETEGRSMMPQGLTKFLTHDELLDLIRFDRDSRGARAPETAYCRDYA